MGNATSQRANVGLNSVYQFEDIGLRATSRAREKFLSNRNAPSLPVSGVRGLIYKSWLRADSKGIEADQFAAPIIESRDRMKELRYDNNQLCRAARKSFVQIGKMLNDAEMMLVLTDRHGVVIETTGDRSTLERGRKINLDVGGQWSEDSAGTNGIGTALFAGKPVFVHGTEHFCEGMNAWSCAAAPIRDPRDQSIVGVVDLSGLTTIFKKHNAAFAAAAAGEIYAALAHEQDVERLRLFEAVLRDLPPGGLNSEALVVVDGAGRLVYAKDLAATEYFANSGSGLHHGQRFVDMGTDMSVDEIYAALPQDLGCKDVRHLEIDGEIRGAAFVIPTRHSGNGVLIDVERLPQPAVLQTGWGGKFREKMVGKSEPFREALDVAQRIARVNAPTLIEGETGVGKEMFARFIHARAAPGDGNPFVPVNCSAAQQSFFVDVSTPEGLTEPTDQPEPPMAEEPGVLCLDKVGKLPLEIQPSVQRLIENGQVSDYLRQLGLADGFKVISLTSRNLAADTEAGRFEKDLYYQIGAMVLNVPPLRDRGEDVLLLAEHFNVEISDKMGTEQLILEPAIQDILLTYQWPGNVRELRNLMAQLHCLARERRVTKDDLPRDIIDAVEHSGSLDQSQSPDHLKTVGALALKDAEKAVILQALGEHGGNLSKTSEALGISRPTLYRKMKIYHIER